MAPFSYTHLVTFISDPKVSQNGVGRNLDDLMRMLGMIERRCSIITGRVASKGLQTTLLKRIELFEIPPQDASSQEAKYRN